MSNKRFQRKLHALQFPHWATFNINEYENIKSLIVYLEGQYIRELTANERQPLKDIKKKNWIDTFESYLDRLDCPYNLCFIDNKKNVSCDNWVLLIEWLLSEAISREWQDNKKVYNAKKPKRRTKNKEYKINNILTNECKNELKKLCQLLNIPYYNNIKILCNTLYNFIKQKFDPLSIYNFEEYTKEESKQNKKNIKDNRYKNTNNYNDIINNFSQYLDFDTGNDKVNAAAIILRMLYIYNLKQEQSQLNEIINFIQTFTANPKTNSALGKVGT
mmetsp:Transcript_59933/g.73419  ORF Transcript_59933/g.73419 Transcript_59933/m.73419 type:complete len:274 (+) Transcript_59933:68-889(+)